MHSRREMFGKIIRYALLFVASFGVGFGSAYVIHNFVKPQISSAASDAIMGEVENWGLGFGESGTQMQPTGTATADELKEYQAYYIGSKEEKKIYLTFDAGFENGNTEPILDALKKHNAPATFFLVGHYLKSAPELVKRMEEEGHVVANHTFHHPEMASIADKASFQKELDEVNALYKEITGKEMTKYYRPPQGKYNVNNLKMAKELGYQTFFWSLAYVDWNVDAQPTKEEAMEKLTGRIHPGAVVLLHSTSATNAQIMDELLTKWEEMGYTFCPLSDLISTKICGRSEKNVVF